MTQPPHVAACDAASAALHNAPPLPSPADLTRDLLDFYARLSAELLRRCAAAHALAAQLGQSGIAQILSPTAQSQSPLDGLDTASSASLAEVQAAHITRVVAAHTSLASAARKLGITDRTLRNYLGALKTGHTPRAWNYASASPEPQGVFHDAT